MGLNMRPSARRLAGNHRAQRLLEWTVAEAQELMGIGSGDSPESSGEKGVLALLLRRLEAPFCVFDVGANRGQFLRMARKALAGHETQFHAFEPASASFDELRRTSEGHGVVLNNLALGTQPGDAVSLYADEPGSEMASLTRRRLGHGR